MFCPKCGDTMTRAEGTWYCASGDMALAGVLDRELTQLVEAAPVEQHSSGRQSQSHLNWYCPRCRGTLSSLEPRTIGMSCGACGLQLPGPVVYRLVETHPHRSADGSWC